MNLFLLYISLFLKLNSISGLLPEDAVLTQTIKGDCTGDESEEIIVVYDIDARFGTENYQGTCVAILEETEEGFVEVFKYRLSADTKVRFVKIFDELPPFVEVQWFHSAGGGNTYICYDEELKRFRETLNIESGGLNKEDIDGDGREEVFSVEFELLQCNGEEDEINAGFLTFYKWIKNSLVSSPESPYIMRPVETYFAKSRGGPVPNLLTVSPEESSSDDYAGPGDLSCKFYITIDTTLLVINIMVSDDVIVQGGIGKDIVNGDHLIILLDTDLEKDFCSKLLDSDDVVIGISPGNFIDISPDVVNLNPVSILSENVAKNTEIQVTKQIGGYRAFVELNLSKKIFAKGIFGLGIILCDRDKESSGTPEVQTSWPVSISKKDPTTWGNLYIAEY